MNVPLPPGPPFFRFSNPEESERMLNAAGFVDVRVVQIPQVWRMPSGEELYNTMRRAAVRTAALLNMQTPEALEAIRAAILERTEQFRTPSGIVLPMPSILSYCRRGVFDGVYSWFFP
jgi:hypothetical protein